MIITVLKNAIRFSTIFLFGSTGETITEKSGHLNMGTPGIMCIGAVGGVFGEWLYLSQILGQENIANINPFLAVFIPLIFTLIAGALGGLLFSFFTVTLRCNQNVTGLTLTTFGAGLNIFLISRIDKTNFSVAAEYWRTLFPQSWIDSTGWFGELFLSYGILVYLAIGISIAAALLIRNTNMGLSLRAVGENAATADAAGINVGKYRYLATMIGGAISGLGGTFFIMDYLSGGVEYTIDAFGWMAVALVIFTVWQPDIGIAGSILFGFLYILPSYVEGLSFAQKELVKLIPYVVTILVLVITSLFNRKETQPPAGLGVDYFREDR